MNLEKFFWIREPKSTTIKDGVITIITEPYTDLWQRTYYHFRNDNAPVFQINTEEQFFSFVVKTCYESGANYEQAGIVMYLDSENWVKAAVEYGNEKMQYLGCVVTNNGYSDWSSTDINANIKTMWFRLSRRNNDFCIENSYDGITFQQMRIFHMFNAQKKISFGIYACSPENSSFKAEFSDLQVTECKWLAHSGQQPDEE